MVTGGSVLASSARQLARMKWGSLHLWNSRCQGEQRPRVLLITVGAGVVDILDPVKPGQMRNSARYVLAGMIADAGCEVCDIQHITTGRIGIESALTDCRECDAVVWRLDLTKSTTCIAAVAGVGEVLFERI